MDTEKMILELRRLESKHKDDKVNTFQTDWSLMCHDVANRLEELNKYKVAIDKIKDGMTYAYCEDAINGNGIYEVEADVWAHYGDMLID